MNGAAEIHFHVRKVGMTYWVYRGKPESYPYITGETFRFTRRSAERKMRRLKQRADLASVVARTDEAG